MIQVGAGIVVALVAAHAIFTVLLDSLLLYVSTAALGASPLLWMRAAHTPRLFVHPITTLAHALQSAAAEAGGQGLAIQADADAPLLLARKLLFIALANCVAFAVWALFGFLSADAILSASYSVGFVVAGECILIYLLASRSYRYISCDSWIPAHDLTRSPYS